MSLLWKRIDYDDMIELDSEYITGPVMEESNANDAAEEALRIMQPGWVPTKLCFYPKRYLDGHGRQAIGTFWVLP